MTPGLDRPAAERVAAMRELRVAVKQAIAGPLPAGSSVSVERGDEGGGGGRKA